MRHRGEEQALKVLLPNPHACPDFSPIQVANLSISLVKAQSFGVIVRRQNRQICIFPSAHCFFFHINLNFTLLRSLFSVYCKPRGLPEE